MNNDSVLLIGFGGPESADDVQPFLAKVLRGRRVSKERVEEVARHYEAIGGRSPINDLTNRQAYALKSTLEQRGFLLPIHTGMRNWHPFLTDSVQQMASEGIEKAIGLIMAPQQCDASRERYQRDVDEAVSKASVQFSVRYPKSFHDHPLFIKAAAGKVDPVMDQPDFRSRIRGQLVKQMLVRCAIAGKDEIGTCRFPIEQFRIDEYIIGVSGK